MTFKELELNDALLKSLQKHQFDQPTEIQQKAIPVFLNNQNLFGKSSTGTGKTASFVLPILERIDVNNRDSQALILVPTRELALQILDEIRKFSSFMEHISVAGVIGGARLNEQIKKIKQSQIIVGTPGRINDHLNRKTLKLNHLKTVILDEADEMLKMGFKTELDNIFKLINAEVQVGLFSATINPKTLQLADQYMKHYELIEVKNQFIINQNLNNTYAVTKGYNKEDVLLELIKKYEMKKLIIFANKKSDTKKIAQFLTQNKISNQVINGDLKQSQRTRVMKEFKNDKFQALIATDVVARGIHVDDVDYVINFELPIDEEYFVHRIGRTGRNNHSGSTITLLNNYGLLQRLNFIIKKFKLEISEEVFDTFNLEKVVEKQVHKNYAKTNFNSHSSSHGSYAKNSGKPKPQYAKTKSSTSGKRYRDFDQKKRSKFYQ